MNKFSGAAFAITSTSKRREFTICEQIVNFLLTNYEQIVNFRFPGIRHFAQIVNKSTINCEQTVNIL